MAKSILYVGNKLAKHGRTVSTIDSLSVLLEDGGYKVITASSKKNKLGRLLDMIQKTIRYRNKVDLVLIDTYSTQNFYYAVIVAKLCRMFKIPYYTILHGGNLPKRLSENPKTSKKLFEGAKLNISPSLFLMETFRNKGYNNITYVPNSIELVNYNFFLRKEIRPKLLWVRSFAEIYNPMLAIEVLKNLRERGIDASLTMVGPDKDGSMERCKTEALRQQLPVIFTGKLEKLDWIELSKQHDIFINTTNFDNMPVSLIEAMALGLPIISTNVGGIPFLVKNNETGILVHANDIKLFTEAIIDLLASPVLVERLSKNGRALAETFAWKEVKRKWHSLLSE